MSEAALWHALSDPLWEDIRDDRELLTKRPYLAHYTSLEVLEKILTTDEIWFSNPLFMNDLEEVRFGIVNGARAFKASTAIREALKTPERYARFVYHLDWYIQTFEREHLLDVYVFCLSEHDPKDNDGLLSMWRGYGGNGKGAALVFDTSKVTYTEGSALVVAKVHYASDEERYAWFDRACGILSKALSAHDVPDDKIYLAANAAFERLKLFALFTKHTGFKEEAEWRVVYLSERDQHQALKGMLHYLNGPRGVEPKLRFKVGPIDRVTGTDLSLGQIISAILLGPSVSSPLAIQSVSRMLDVLGKGEFKGRVHASTIPFRAT